MRRRLLLAAVGTGLIAGCSGELPRRGSDRPATSTSGYETCDRVRIPYAALPAPLRAEVDAALAADRYHRDQRPALADAIDVDRSFVVVEGTPYDPDVYETADGFALELAAVAAVRLPAPREIVLENLTDAVQRLHVVLTADAADGGRLVDATVSLAAGEATSLEATDAFGSYMLHAATETGPDEATVGRFVVDDSHVEGYVYVTETDVGVSQAVADREPCPWDRRTD